jgi:hypothetical protein
VAGDAVAFDWHEFLVLARSLVSDPQESAQRTAISRAYFAAYGHAFDYAKRYLRFVPRADSDDHGRLRDHLKRSRRAGIAESLHWLREARNRADYNSEFGDDVPTVVAECLVDAQYVFDGLPPPSS